MKKLLLLCSLLLLLALPVSAEEVKEIHTPQDLADMAKDPSGSYVLCEDLDMTGFDWTPFDFFGTLDGGGHAILNLEISCPGEDTAKSLDGNQLPYDTYFAGLFAVMENAHVHDLSLVGFRGYVESSEHIFLGSLAGKSLDSEIEDCTFSGTLELRAYNGIFGVGGVVGYGSGNVNRCNIDVTLICVDTDPKTRDEQFLGGIYSTGFMGASDNVLQIDGYVSEHGYVHNGGVTGMMMQYPLGSNKDANIDRNTITGKITFFEDNTDRRAYCEALFGEVLAWGYTAKDNETDFLRDERREYDRELRPEMCENPAYSENIVAPGCDRYGWTEHTCSSCGYTFRDAYTLPEHTVTEWHVVTPATVDAPGLSAANCDGCGLEFTREDPTLPPEPETEPVTEPAVETEPAAPETTVPENTAPQSAAPQAALPKSLPIIGAVMLLTLVLVAVLFRKK